MSKLSGASFWWDTSAEHTCSRHMLFNVAHLSGSPGQSYITCCCCSSPSALVSLGHEETSADWLKLHSGHPKQLSPFNPLILICACFQSGLRDTPGVVPSHGAAWGYLTLFLLCSKVCSSGALLRVVLVLLNSCGFQVKPEVSNNQPLILS